MGDAAQAGFNRPDHDICLRIRLPAALRIDDNSAIRAAIRRAIRRIGIIGTNLAVSRITVDHRIHVAGRHAEKEIRPAKHAERLGGMPVRLGNDAHAKALRFEQAPDQRRTEARMVNIGIAGNDDHITGIPTQRLHFFT